MEWCVRPGGQILAITHLPEYYMEEFELLVAKYVQGHSVRTFSVRGM